MVWRTIERVLPRRRRSHDRTLQDALRRAVLLPERFGPSPTSLSPSAATLPGGSLPHPSSGTVSLAYAEVRCAGYYV
jgi:hypothetical protein